MGSSYFGEMNMGSDNQRRSGSSSSSSSSSRKGRKGSSEKPKQPQRGLGVAQLEKIRLHGEMGCAAYQQQQQHQQLYPNSQLQSQYPSNFTSDDMRMQTTYSSLPSSSFSYSTSPTPSSSSPSYGFHPNFQTGIGEYERANFRYGDSQPTNNAVRWDPSNTFLETQHFGQPNMTRHLFNQHEEDSMHKNTNTKYGSDSIGSSSQNSESSETQELDLELRLSL